MKVDIKYFISLISAAVNGSAPPEPPEDTDWRALYAFAKLHQVEALICSSIERSEVSLPDGAAGLFEKAQLTAITHDQTQRGEAGKILESFEKNGIDCIPLKGLIMKTLYPAPFLRSMCDLDIMFRPEDSEKVNETLTALGYTATSLGGNPETYEKTGKFVEIEMHKALIRDKTDHFAKTWDRAAKREGYEHIYDMSREDFYIFMMAHLRKHYIGNGTGLRSVLDIFLYERKYGDSLDREYIENQFKLSGFGDFPEQIIRTADIWFAGKPDDPELRDMQKHLLSSGAYGFNKFSRDEYISDKIREKGRAGYILSLVFPSKDVMTDKYPFLKKLPFLIPVMWIFRWVSSLVLRAKNVISLLKKTSSL